MFIFLLEQIVLSSLTLTNSNHVRAVQKNLADVRYKGTAEKLIYNLHLLRGVAATMVLLHHLRGNFQGIYPDILHYVVGAAGVDLFFVLSGVVITLAEQRRADEPIGFIKRRIIRVVPMYWLALAVIGVMLVAGLSPVGVQPVDASMGNMLRSLFFIPFERAHGAIMPLLGVGWTLNYEVFFYAVFASLMFLPKRHRAFYLIALMSGFVVLGAVLPLSNTTFAFYTNPIILEFAAGVGLAHLWIMNGFRSGFNLPIGGALICIGMAALALNARQEDFNHLMQSRIILFGVPAALCVSGAMLLERGGFYIRRPSVLLFGAISYALYLFHPVVLQIIKVCLTAIGFEGAGLVVVIWTAVFGFLWSYVTSLAIHLCIERPMTGWLRRVVKI